MRNTKTGTDYLSRAGALGIIELRGDGGDNRLTPGAALNLHEALVAFDADPALQLGLLTAGAKHFCAGGDLKTLDAFRQRFADPAHVFMHRHYPLHQAELSFEALWPTLFGYRTRKPIIVAIEGDCLDLGLAIIGLHGDIRIAGRSARFGFPGIRSGEMPGLAVVSRLDQQIPRAVFNWMVETGERLDAVAALDRGLISEVVADGEVASRALALAERILARRIDGTAEKAAALMRSGETFEPVWSAR
jgi:enoyl-CoA hydratase/carnithine racemase